MPDPNAIVQHFFQLELRDNEPFMNGEDGHGHRWTKLLTDPKYAQECYNFGCHRVARWQRDTMEHPNYVDSRTFCSAHAEALAEEVKPTAWMVLWGDEEGFAPYTVEIQLPANTTVNY